MEKAQNPAVDAEPQRLSLAHAMLWFAAAIAWVSLGIALALPSIITGAPPAVADGGLSPAHVSVCELSEEAGLAAGLRIGFWRGVIEPEGLELLRRLLDADIQVLDLASDGGDLNTAIVMAGEIEKAALMTHVSAGQGCFSACLVLYQAGRVRHPDEAAVFMIHYALQKTPDLKMAEGARFEGTVLFFESLIERGASPAIYENVPPYGELYLTAADAQALGIIAGTRDALGEKNAAISGAMAAHCTPLSRRWPRYTGLLNFGL